MGRSAARTSYPWTLALVVARQSHGDSEALVEGAVDAEEADILWTCRDQPGPGELNEDLHDLVPDLGIR